MNLASPGNKVYSTKGDLLNLNLLNQAENISVVPSSSPIKYGDKSVKGFMSYDQTYKQTNKQRILLFIYI